MQQAVISDIKDQVKALREDLKTCIDDSEQVLEL